ncbi:MAG: Gfo/Idh/MocA family oxidoreductase [Planctomycetes bacterium]|nr:Gfo/Idh/MocA family oxidoreductase [Planctomycetota bacterium]
MSANKKEYGIAIIACGARGKAHAAAWAKLDKVSINAVADPDAERAQALAKEHGAEVAEDYKAAIDRSDVDIVSVCTPASFHAEPTIFAADRGKHILCEKPMAVTITDGARMLDAVAQNKVKLSFSFQSQYNEITEKLREIMDKGEIGRPVMARMLSAAEIRPKLAMHSKTGNNGPVNDICPHTFTLWRTIFRSEPVRVQAAGMSIAKDAEELKDIKDIAIDTATLLVTFASGDIGVYSITWGLPRGTKPSSYQDIVGPKGMLKPAGRTLTIIKGGEETVLKDLAMGGNDAQAAAFLKCIEEDTDPQNSGRDAMIALETSLAALESVETGRAVRIEV